ncbi:MAG: ATP-binding protein [Pseudomonadota bacterium]
MTDADDEEKQLRTVALQLAQSIRLARRRADEDVRRAKVALELKNEELAQQKEWFEVTLSSIGDAVITTDTAGRVTFMNPVAEAMTGWNRDQAAGQPLTTVFHILDERTRKPAINPVEEVLRDGKTVALANHTVLIGKHGSETAIEDSAAPIRNNDGKIIGVVMVFHDVLERRLAAKTLREEGRTLELLNVTGATIASQLNYEAVVKIVTDAATELSGAQFGAFFYTRTDEDGEVFTLNHISGADRALFDGLGHPRATPIFAPTFEGKPAVRVDDIMADPRYGKWAPHYGMPKGHLPVRSYLAVPVVSRDGSVIGGLFFGHSTPGIFTERSERIVVGIAAYAAIALDNARLYEEAQREIARRQKAEEALRDVDRRKDEFLALLAHELRNPLAPIRQVANLWKQQTLSEERMRWAQNVVDRQSGHMSLLLDDLLDLSRIKRGSLQLRKEWIKLAGVIDAAVEAASPLISARKHELQVDMPQPDLQLQADPLRLTQVLANLLNNAAKYTDPGGRIRLAVAQQDGTIEIKVADTGIGIATEQQPRVFEIFFQSTAPIDRVEGGLGLGLALVKGIVTLHDGEVAVKSEGLGTGTEFIVQLPRGTAPAQTATGSARPAAVSQHRTQQRILIADDNHDSADSLAIYLRGRGHEVATVYSGEDAINAFQSAPVDWIIMDIGMPKLNGYETARRIRSLAPGRTIKLVAVTGWGQDIDKQLAANAGFDHHFTKPADPVELADLLEKQAVSPS